MNRSGLGLFGLIIILLILSLFAASYVDVKNTDEFKKQEICLSRLDEISKALTLYRKQHRGMLPDVKIPLRQSLSRYKLSDGVFRCPFHEEKGQQGKPKRFYIKRSTYDDPGSFVICCPHRDGTISGLLYSGDADIFKKRAVLSEGAPVESGSVMSKDLVFYDNSSIVVKKGSLTLIGSVSLSNSRYYHMVELSTKVGEISITTGRRAQMDVIAGPAGIIRSTKNARVIIRWFLQADRQIAEVSVRDGYAVLSNDFGTVTIAENQLAFIEPFKSPVMYKHRRLYTGKQPQEIKQ